MTRSTLFPALVVTSALTLLIGCSTTTTTTTTVPTSPTATPTLQTFCGTIESPTPSTINVTLAANGDMSLHIPVMGDPIRDLKYMVNDAGTTIIITNVNTSSELSDFNFKFAFPNPSLEIVSIRRSESIDLVLGWFPQTTLYHC